MQKWIEFSLKNRVLVLLSAVVLLVFAWRALTQNLAMDVLPDLTKPTVTILAEAKNLSPEEVETRVVQPIELALQGVPGMTRLRSQADVGLGVFYAEFDYGADTSRLRPIIAERLRLAQLPAGVEPYLTPEASMMGEVMMFGVTSSKLSPPDVRLLADWTLRPRLQAVAGVAEVINMGGGIQQIHISPDPEKMRAYGVSHDEIEKAASQLATTSSAGYSQQGGREIFLRQMGAPFSLEPVEKLVVKATPQRPIHLKEVATISWGLEPMRGDASVNGKRGVILSVVKSRGIDSLKITRDLKAALTELSTQIPPDTRITPLFQQADFIQHSLQNVQDALRDGAIMVAVVLWLFLRNNRATLITLLSMPLSFAATLCTFEIFSLSLNSMTLGGMAIAIGLVVDDAIVDVENVLRRLRENAQIAQPLSKTTVILQASGEIRHSLFYATILIVLSFTPLFGLSGLEGKLFFPIALATVISLLASFVISLTIVPVLCSLLLQAQNEHRDPFLVRSLKSFQQKIVLAFALRHPRGVFLACLISIGSAFALTRHMGREFLPHFLEDTAVVATAAQPGTSLDSMNSICDGIERKLLAIPGVSHVGRRIGRAERGDHIVPISTAEFDVGFDATQITREKFLESLRHATTAIPGTFSAISAPLQDRIGHMLSGVSAPVAIKFYGPDLATLRQLAESARALGADIPGLSGIRLSSQALVPQWQVVPDAEKLATHGLNPQEFQTQLAHQFTGFHAARWQNGLRQLDVMVKNPTPQSPQQLENQLIQLTPQLWLPLHEVAKVHTAQGPSLITRENQQRCLIVSAQLPGKDPLGAIQQWQQKLAKNLTLPAAYSFTIEGDSQAQQRASQRIFWLAALVQLVLALLLYRYFASWSLVLQVLFNLPLAMMGGIVLSWLLHVPLSLASLVGFIAVGGIAARNGIMLLSHFRYLENIEKIPFSPALILRGSSERLVPVLMTALAAGIALIPLVWEGNVPGREILHPVAVVIVGGLFSSTLLDLLVTPALYFWLEKRNAFSRSTTAPPSNNTHPIL